MEKTTSKEFAKALLYALSKFTNSFYEGFGQRAQSMLGNEFGYKGFSIRSNFDYRFSNKKDVEDISKMLSGLMNC
ncbi:MAG: hypothetical protein PHQ54_05195 [Candidatus Omnitrophica bacterium]|nr:hypothetical protein [Candidatus Omnitrophota bacterium]